MVKAITSWTNLPHLTSEKDFAIDPRVYKFVSIIHKVEDDPRESIRNALKLSEKSSIRKIRKRHWIALQYAKILEEHSHLVAVVQMIFNLHIRNDVELFYNGVELSVADIVYFAKVEKNKIRIFTQKKLINEGHQGSVWEVYEVASRELLAFKQAKNGYDEAISREIQILKSLKNREGLQTCPLITLYLDRFNGFIGQKYGLNLEQWIKTNPNQEERLAMSKSLMRAFASKTALEIWHGDLKDINVVVDGEACVIIDWAGAILFENAVKERKLPLYFTKQYTNFADRDLCLSLKRKPQSLYDDQFLQIAHAWDLFSTGMILFKILSSSKPFEQMEDGCPKSWCGISKKAMQKLIERGYGEVVNKTLMNMLNNDYSDRCSDKEAIIIWENI